MLSFGESWVPIEHKVAWAEAFLCIKWRLNPSSRLATIDMGQKLDGSGSCAFFLGSWVPIKHKVAWAEAYLHAKFHLEPSDHLAIVHQRYRQANGEPF